VKVARPVLRGPRRSNALGLPDRVSHGYPAISATFDDPNLVSCAGLAPTMALAGRAGLGDLVADALTLKAKGGVNAQLKVPAPVAGMVAGRHRIGLPRQSQHRDHPPAADRRPGPPGHLRQTTGPAPAQRLAMVGQLARPVQRHLRTTTNSINNLTTQPQQGSNRTTQWKNRTDRQFPHAHSLTSPQNPSPRPADTSAGGSRLKQAGVRMRQPGSGHDRVSESGKPTGQPVGLNLLS